MSTSTWRGALRFGMLAALAHRLALQVWMTASWLLFGRYLGVRADHNLPQALDPVNATVSELPPLEPYAMQVIFGVWRRWDAFHYLYIARNGYTPETPYLSPFPPLVPLLTRAVDRVLPGPPDVAAAVYQTLMFGVLLALLCHLCATCYEDAELGPWACLLLMLLPLAYYFHAPMSETTYITLALAVMLAAQRKRWLLVAVFVFLATLTRRQGVLLVGVAGLFLLEDWMKNPQRQVFRDVLRFSPVLLGPLAFVLHHLYLERVAGYPAVVSVNVDYWATTLVNPVYGYWLNLQWLADHPQQLLYHPRAWAFVLMPVVIIGSLLSKKHRRLPLVGYTLSHALLFIGIITWLSDGVGSGVGHTNNLGRYALYLFPQTIFAADLLRRAPRPVQWAVTGGLAVVLLALAVWHVMLTGPS